MSGSLSEGFRRSCFEGSRGVRGIGPATEGALARIFDLKSSNGYRSQLSAFIRISLPENSGSAKFSKSSLKKMAFIPNLGTLDILPLNF
jgi:hypothetical protein